jgi:type II restriction/modification system DNA methylase subunit YeeA
MAILEPLKDKIEATDKLIDHLVYKLYSLTQEEIKIVETKK